MGEYFLSWNYQELCTAIDEKKYDPNENIGSVWHYLALYA